MAHGGRLRGHCGGPLAGDAGDVWRLGSTVAGRHVFYNRSRFNGDDPTPSAADDAAIAPDKTAALPGNALNFHNVTSYDRGINGVMVDVPNLPEGVTLTPDDFEIGGDGTPPLSVAVRRGAGVDGTDRVTLTWPDYNSPPDVIHKAVGNGWLRVTVKANPRTGLLRPDVFVFGNLVGETGDGDGLTGWRVGALDLSAVRRAVNSPADVASPLDLNRDGRINALDLAIVRRAANRVLPLYVAPPAFAGGATVVSISEELGLVSSEG